MLHDNCKTGQMAATLKATKQKNKNKIFTTHLMFIDNNRQQKQH